VLRDFAATRERDRLGLVAFRARSYVLSPLTLDYGAFQELIDRADELDLRDGTGLGLAVADALNLLRESDARSRVVIVATDGENNQPEVGPLGAARIAEALGVRVYTIGIFSKQAEPPPGVPAGAGEPALRAMAERTDGRYFRAGDPATLARVYDAIDGLERSRVGDERYTAFDELAPYFLAGALAALAAQVLLTTFVLRRLP
jgi:Ca-activated chloride channel family protein